jgi:hypothetical protein
MVSLYATLNKEMRGSLLPECEQEKQKVVPHRKRRNGNSDSDDGSSISKKEEIENCEPLLFYKQPRPVVTKNFFAPLRAVPMEGAEVCGFRQ